MRTENIDDSDGSTEVVRTNSAGLPPPLPGSQESMFSFGAPSSSQTAVSGVEPQGQRSGLSQDFGDLAVQATAGDAVAELGAGPTIDGSEHAGASGQVPPPPSVETEASGASAHGRARARPGSAAAQAVRRNVQTAPRPTEAAAPPSAFANGIIHCPMCESGESAQFSTASGLMRHLTVRHQGMSLTPVAVDVLRDLERAVCSHHACGALNRIGVRRCNRCDRAVVLRTLQAGDVIPGPRGTSQPAAAPADDSVMQADDEAAPDENPHQAGQAARSGIEDVVLPDDWDQRVRMLPPSSLVHVQISFRRRHAEAWIQTLEGMAAKLPGWCRLEEARTRLLLAEFPRGTYGPRELGERFALWESGSYEALLCRAEAQQLLRRHVRRNHRAKRPGADRQAQLARAMRMVGEGAYRKAIGAVTSNVADITVQQEMSFAQELLPSSTRPDALSSTAGGARAGSNADVQARANANGSRDNDHPLKGVKYGALTAPAPTGTRPEHAKEAFGIRQKPIARRLARAMLEVQALTRKGDLPPEAKWLKRTRLVYLEKRGSDKPRPIRIGEFLRSSTAKKVQKEAAPKLRKVFRGMHQWGIEMPGGAEALVHWRGTVEELAKSGVIDPMVAFDLDLENMFCRVEWPEIRAAAQKHFEEAYKWLEWCHEEPEVIQLPNGAEHAVNRGAGQGDVYGSTACGLSLGERVLEHRERFNGTREDIATTEAAGAVDEWFIDDGQAFVFVRHADLWLRSVDKAIADLGGRRKRGEGCKSHARLLCPLDFAAANPSWASPYIRDTCIVESCAVPPKALGVHIGDEDVCSEDLASITKKVCSARDAIQELNAPAAELTLQRCCLNVSKAAYLLRCNGDRIKDSELSKFDVAMASGLESALWGPLPDDSWLQATMSVDAGGLGMREAALVALPAFVASRTVARPLVAEMAAHCAEAGLCAIHVIMDAYDRRSDAASARWLETLPEDVHHEIRTLLADAAEQAVVRWQRCCDGTEATEQLLDSRAATNSTDEPGSAVVGDVGTQDPEWPGNLGSTIFHLQQLLTRFADRCVAQGLLNKFAQEQRWDDKDRMQDLVAEDANHEWLWAVHAKKNKVMNNEEYVSAVRLRLGCGGPEEPSVCGNCGEATIGRNGTHGLLCCKGESTRGHNAIRDELHSIATPIDRNAETEPEGLIASQPRLRPADVLTGAFHNGRLAAVDVGVISPSAAGAGHDCVVTMHERKCARMERYKRELEASGAEYHPFAVSCWGRLHPSASAMLLSAAKRIARRQGTNSERVTLRRFRARVAALVWRRAARMALRCLPRPSDDEDDDAHAAEQLDPHSSARAGSPASADLPALHGAH